MAICFCYPSLYKNIFFELFFCLIRPSNGVCCLKCQISWMEKFVLKGTEITAPVPMAPPGTTGLGGFEVPLSKGGTLRPDASALNVGVLHLVPTLEVFPLLADPKVYEPNTIDLADHSELEYWFTVLSEHLPDLVDKAVASEGGTDDAERRGDAFARAFSAHLAR
ncbi:hypothetical protein Pint_15448 [Pistacia integerrima]|uniref:Uncharacterized protein n=1 Tax=Pistacia integerrima TaxID=434235 RepID=A0ACC0ZAT7_9ROSI|nr:hypothetical protein Pint_15448 [Pistacia integerrima]